MGKDQDRRKTKIDWKTYNKKLVQKGRKFSTFKSNLNVYIHKYWDRDLEEKNLSRDRSKGGSDFEYPDMLFLFLYIIKIYNALGYRELEGYVYNLFDKVPNFRTIQKRIKALDSGIIKKIDDAVLESKLKDKKLRIAMDGTGLQINESYVWNEDKHGEKKRRKWKKVHFAADIDSGMIVGFNMYEYNENEAETERLFEFTKMLLDRIGDVAVLEKIFGDGAYDNAAFFELLKELGIEPIIKIDKEAINIIEKQLRMNKMKLGTPYKQWKPPDERYLKAMEQLDWKKFVNNKRYGLRSSIEGIIGAFKKRFGGCLFSKQKDIIFKEVAVKILMWNVMHM